MSRKHICITSLIWGCVSITSNVSASEVTTYIVNGSDVSASTLSEQYPNFASLFYDNGASYGNTCGATIINSEYVLTAAHCIFGDYDGMLHAYVAAGLDNESDFFKSNVIKARVEEFYYPDDYDDSRNDLWPNDIAILKLEEPLNISDYGYLINTQVNDNYPLNKGADTFVAIGHGLVAGNVDGGDILQQTNLTHVATSECGRATTDKQLCFDGELSGIYKTQPVMGIQAVLSIGGMVINIFK